MSDMVDKSQVYTRRSDGSLDVGTVNDQPSMTDQSYKDDCDVNHIMKRYQTTGEFSHATSKEGFYADFSGITDFQSMVETVKYAQEAFMTLPAETRYRFRNDPGQLLEFIQDDKNYAEALKLGLVQPKNVLNNAINNNDSNNDKNAILKNKKVNSPKKELDEE